VQHEEDQDSSDRLAEIWRSAERRRTDDMLSVFMHLREAGRKLKSRGSPLQYFGDRVTSWMWKIFDATRRGQLINQSGPIFMEMKNGDRATERL
jgi:hypothetical protein